MGLPINTFKKVGDFGCGWGYITWSLMQEISVSECIGIDKFDPKTPPVWYQVEAGFSLEKTQELSKQIDANKYPDFRQVDIISGKNIPSDFDLIYCKRLLYNIFNENSRLELGQAINHIAQALKPNGWFCLVEINDLSFKTSLEEVLTQANFEFNLPRCVYRPYEAFLQQKVDDKPYLIYQCKLVKTL